MTDSQATLQSDSYSHLHVPPTHILAGDGDGSPGFDDPSLHDDPHHQRVSAIEDAVGQNPQLAGEYRNVLKLLPLLLVKLLQREREKERTKTRHYSSPRLTEGPPCLYTQERMNHPKWKGAFNSHASAV